MTFDSIHWGFMSMYACTRLLPANCIRLVNPPKCSIQNAPTLSIGLVAYGLLHVPGSCKMVGNTSISNMIVDMLIMYFESGIWDYLWAYAYVCMLLSLYRLAEIRLE
jgi:hypothetical protein